MRYSKKLISFLEKGSTCRILEKNYSGLQSGLAGNQLKTGWPRMKSVNKAIIIG